MKILSVMAGGLVGAAGWIPRALPLTYAADAALHTREACDACHRNYC
jgi:hypothetical protein